MLLAFCLTAVRQNKEINDFCLTLLRESLVAAKILALFIKIF